MVNYIRLAWKLACILRIYRTCNSTVGFLKYEFNNKILGGIILLRVTLSVTWTQPPPLSLSLYIYIINIIMGANHKAYNLFIYLFFL